MHLFTLFSLELFDRRVEKAAVFFDKIFNLMFLLGFSVIRWNFGIFLVLFNGGVLLLVEWTKLTQFIYIMQRLTINHSMSFQVSDCILNKSETLHLNCLPFIYKMMQASKANESLSECSKTGLCIKLKVYGCCHEETHESHLN